jgi:hypothetical protein
MGRAMIRSMNLTESRALAARLASLLENEQHALADFLVALAGFDRGPSDGSGTNHIG